MKSAKLDSVLVAAGLLLTGCSSPGMDSSSPAQPLAVGNGIGSQYGNYAARLDGEYKGPEGQRCVVYNWDRPLTKDLAVRLKSASCDSLERPGWSVCTELSRTIIPISESNLADGEP